MRKVILVVNMTLDGAIAGPAGELAEETDPRS